MVPNNYYLSDYEAKKHIPLQPNLTATRYHSWTFYREYKILSSEEELIDFVENQTPDRTTGGDWFKWDEYNSASNKYLTQRNARKKNQLEGV